MEHIYERKLRSLGNWAQIEMEVPLQQLAKIEIIKRDMDPAHSIPPETIFILNDLAWGPLGNVKFTLLHEAAHRKQDLELEEKMRYKKTWDLERDADERALRKLTCRTCIKEASFIRYEIEPEYMKTFVENGYLPPLDFALRYFELKKNNSPLCPFHQRNKIYKLITPIIAHYGLL